MTPDAMHPDSTVHGLMDSNTKKPEGNRHHMKRVEVWGGIECTVNRLQDRYCDQLTRFESCGRHEDMNLIADLGLHAVRFPLAWERMQPDRNGVINWAKTDAALNRLRERGVRPILGLLHHGYGPAWSGLLDPSFPTNFAQYADMVAARYPWIDAYTPINEPLTTARFSGLYGLWYPHARDEHIFAQLLLAECQATRQAMRSIRQINPQAQLIQTEDLGKTSSTSALQYQCEFENERRWLTWDLLNGSLGPSHPMWEYLHSIGISDKALSELVDFPCPPDIIGINYYVTSERFLDDRIDLYKASERGGNGRHQYADVATASIPEVEMTGIEVLLKEAWNRYRVPLAVTECHIGCTREEQLRWLHGTWAAAMNLLKNGVDVRAITSWGLLGLYDWNSLLTREDGHYEPGAFDLRAPAPRPTGISTMVRALATQGEYTHPVLSLPGWWRRSRTKALSCSPGESSPRSIIITGATGTLGNALARICDIRGLAYHLLNRNELDIADPESIQSALRYYRPWAVINAAGYVRVEEAERDRDACWRSNTTGPEALARLCLENEVALVTYSSDLVFDGQKGMAYVESDTPCPTTCYGESKAAAEAVVLTICPNALMIRTSAFFGPWDSYNLVTRALAAIKLEEIFPVPKGVVITPTYVPDLAQATLDLLLDGVTGIWHLSNNTPVTWHGLIEQAATMMGYSNVLSTNEEEETYSADPIESANYSLTSERGWIMPPLETALRHYVHEMQNYDKSVQAEIAKTIDYAIIRS